MSGTLKKSLIVAFLVFVAVGLIGLWGDFQEVGSSIAEFDYRLLPVLLLIAFVSYAARGVRWHVLLNLVSDERIERQTNAMIYTASLVGIVTPAKAGEVTRAYYAKERFDVSMSRSAPVLLSERLMDGVAMVLFAAFGLFLYEGWLVVAWLVIVAGLAALILSMRSETVLNKVVELARKLPGADKDVDDESEFVQTALRVFKPVALAKSLAFGLVVWGTQALVYFVAILGVGESLTLDTLLRSIFVYPMAMLIGTVTLLPLGLGPTDASLVFIGYGLFDLEWSGVLVAAFVTRAVIILPALAAGFLASMSPQVRPLIASG